MKSGSYLEEALKIEWNHSLSERRIQHEWIIQMRRGILDNPLRAR